MRFPPDRPLTHRPPARWVRVLCTFLSLLIFWTPAAVVAQEAEEHVFDEEAAAAVQDEITPYADDVRTEPVDQPITAPDSSAPDDPTRTPIALPGGQGASAVTPQAISLPNAEGSIEGMGESFSPVLSSGTASFSVPIAVAPGRAGVQPSLALSYATSGGNGPVGFGWGVGAPFISRQSDRGLPRYVDQPLYHAEEDRFIYNGGQELVPVAADAIGIVEGQANYGDPPAIPGELEDWQQYRARVEGGFMRFFRSPDSLRWIVQSKDGTRFDFGLLEDGPSEAITASSGALERDPERTSGGVFRWQLTRMSDPHGSTVYYIYDNDRGQSYLTDVYYVSRAICAASSPEQTRQCTQPLSSYGAHLRLVYQSRDDVFASYVTGWRIETARRLKRIEVTAYDDDLGERGLVRRYHLRYGTDTFHSLLSEVQVEGRPQQTVQQSNVGLRTVRETELGDAIRGELLPAMRFRYSAMPTDSGAIPGFGGVDTEVRSVANSPPHSVDEARSDLFDVNSDGLPDLIVTDPARYRANGAPAVGVFFNGFSGSEARPAGAAAHFSAAVPMPMPPELSSVMNLGNANVVPMDMDGDGRSDLLHMPRLRTYGWWAPTREEDEEGEPTEVSPADQGWRWTYASIDLPLDDTDPRIDFGRDSQHIRILDVNNDHLIDVVRTTGTGMQTWLNLGWLPGGDGRFGSFRWTGSDWELSTLPIESCLLHAGVPIDFEDPEVRLADMNGDGLQDIVKVRRGRVIYWPGRGVGSWGDGPHECARGEGDGRYIEMTSPPAELNVELDGVFLEDVNMDGASDLVQVRFRELDVYFNRAGASWTARTIARNTPFAPAFAPRIRFADIDGSATGDIVYANAGNWQYIDLAGGQRPRMLVGVENGLGASTDITYGSSADDYLTDLAYADTCRTESCERFTWGEARGGPDARLQLLSGESVYRSAGSPVISTVVRGVKTSDNFDVLGREEQVSESQFAYHDGYYEGIEQEFRGFGAADAVTLGDWNNPTAYSRTYFLQGRRPSTIADDRLADNPNEALKGREVMTEVFDEQGRFLTTSWASIANRLLLVGLDGREIHYAYVDETNELRYDSSPYEADGTSMTVDAVMRQEVDPATGNLRDLDPASGAQTSVTDTMRTVVIRGARAARIRTTFDDVDNLGHVLVQTAHGQVGLPNASPIDPLIVSHTQTQLVNEAEWIWRTATTWVDGGPEGALGTTYNSYSGAGDLLDAVQVPSSPREFYFAGESADEGGAATVPHLDMDVVASTVYDAWGNAFVSCAGNYLGTSADPNNPNPYCLRYGYVTYDSVYAQLAVGEHVRGSTTTPYYLDYSGTWDRGLGAITKATDPNGLSSCVTYDGLGRLTSVMPPTSGDCEGALPTARIAYELTQNPGAQPISRVVTTSELDADMDLGEDGDSITSIAYVDGLGRARASITNGSDQLVTVADDVWVRSGIATLDKKGSVRRTYQSDFYDGAPADVRAILSVPAGIPYTTTRYDAFGRARGVHAEDNSVTWTSMHALSADVCDALDNDPSSEHYRTCTFMAADGHGRAHTQVLRNRNPDTGANESYVLWTWYRTDGAVLALVRAKTEIARPASWTSGLPTPSVVRTFTYDTIGRRLSSDDPDTDDPTNGDQGSNSWRYAFNRVGDLVAVRDPRGCGQNFFYDYGGRLRGEQYVSCAEAQSHAAERPPAENTVSGLISMFNGQTASLDVVYHYDAYPAWASSLTAPDAIPATASGVKGRATGVSDRGQRAAIAYDHRGNVTWTARQMALISEEIALSGITVVDGRPVQTETAPTPGEVEYDEVHTYVRTATFDHAGRPRTMILPRDPDFDDEDPAPAIGGLLVYNRRGLPAQAAAFVGCNQATIDSFATTNQLPSNGCLQPIVAGIDYTRDGLVSSMTYGDNLNGRTPTRSETVYDARRRPIRFVTAREQTDATAQSLGAVTGLVDQQLVWDAASNLTDQIDHRDPAEWPANHRPQTVHIRHDALYRVIGAEFEYTQSDGSRTEQDGFSDWRDDFDDTIGVDPMRQIPAPLISSDPAGRVASLTWEWDYLANTTHWGDNANSFYERSIGAITNGDDDTGNLRPSALYVASNIGDGLGGGAGWLEVDYGKGGNMTAMTVHSQCTNGTATCDDPGGDVAARVAALRGDCTCASEQHYVYRWDELDRLAEARRYDGASGTGWSLAVRQLYRYSAANQRTVKQTIDSAGERVALQVYPGDFERRGLDRGTSAYEADQVTGTETQYVIGGARTVWTHSSTLTGYDREHRFTVPLGDLIQTTAAGIDARTGELLETSTYYPNGARETYRMNDTALTAPEVSGFTGKEGDEEVGLVYFGERYLVGRIGRWASPDPMHVHAVGGGEALNSYHYVGGSLLLARDPLGLWPWEEGGFDRDMQNASRRINRWQSWARHRAERAYGEAHRSIQRAAGRGVAGNVRDAAAGLDEGSLRPSPTPLPNVDRGGDVYRIVRQLTELAAPDPTRGISRMGPLAQVGREARAVVVAIDGQRALSGAVIVAAAANGPGDGGTAEDDGDEGVQSTSTNREPIPGPLSRQERDQLREGARNIWQAWTRRRAIWDSLEVHHRIPLEWSHLFPRVNPNRPANLVGMARPDHNAVSSMWTDFRTALNGRTPTAAEVMDQALKIDQKFGHLMRPMR